jgi:hypothetical protein
MLTKAIFPNGSPSSVRVVLPPRWAELTTNSLQGEKRTSELSRTAHADAHPGRRRELPFGSFTVVRGDYQGKR